jgi:hypothetical protein
MECHCDDDTMQAAAARMKRVLRHRLKTVTSMRLPMIMLRILHVFFLDDTTTRNAQT